MKSFHLPLFHFHLTPPVFLCLLSSCPPVSPVSHVLLSSCVLCPPVLLSLVSLSLSLQSQPVLFSLTVVSSQFRKNSFTANICLPVSVELSESIPAKPDRSKEPGGWGGSVHKSLAELKQTNGSLCSPRIRLNSGEKQTECFLCRDQTGTKTESSAG